MKHFIDGDQVVITKDDFENLQESPAVFMPVGSRAGRNVLDGLSLSPFVSDKTRQMLRNGGGVWEKCDGCDGSGFNLDDTLCYECGGDSVLEGGSDD